jgi:MurNAc alpha-1-phosphate uridylyltransferase
MKSVNLPRRAPRHEPGAMSAARLDAAMILAAGRGERMRPLTDHTPKPLLVVGGKSLIARHLEKLADAGFRRITINHAHMGEMIESAIGDGSRWGLQVRYSPEPHALETAGGIRQALALIGAPVFAVVNADVYSDYEYARLVAAMRSLHQAAMLAHLVLVDNPGHNPRGDFALDRGMARDSGETRLTFSGMGVYRTEMFESLGAGEKHALAPLLRAQMTMGRVSAERYQGRWTDVGTPERLAELDAQLVSEGGA